MGDTALGTPFCRNKEKRPESEKRVHVLGEEMGPEELKEALQVGWLEVTCVPRQDGVCMFNFPLLPCGLYPGLYLEKEMSITYHPLELVAVRLHQNAWTDVFDCYSVCRCLPCRLPWQPARPTQMWSRGGALRQPGCAKTPPRHPRRRRWRWQQLTWCPGQPSHSCHPKFVGSVQQRGFDAQQPICCSGEPVFVVPAMVWSRRATVSDCSMLPPAPPGGPPEQRRMCSTLPGIQVGLVTVLCHNRTLLQMCSAADVLPAREPA